MTVPVSVTDSQTREQKNTYCSAWPAQAQHPAIATHENDGILQSEGERCPHILIIYLKNTVSMVWRSPTSPGFQARLHFPQAQEEPPKGFLQQTCHYRGRTASEPSKICTSCHLCSGFPTATLQAIQKGYFLLPPLLKISVSDVCSFPPCFFHTDEESWKQYGHQISSWFWKQNSSSLL